MPFAKKLNKTGLFDERTKSGDERTKSGDERINPFTNLSKSLMNGK